MRLLHPTLDRNQNHQQQYADANDRKAQERCPQPGACRGQTRPKVEMRERPHITANNPRGNNCTRRVKLACVQPATRRQLRARNEQGHKIDSKHAKGHAKTRDIDENTQRDGNNRRKRADAAITPYACLRSSPRTAWDTMPSTEGIMRLAPRPTIKRPPQISSSMLGDNAHRSSPATASTNPAREVPAPSDDHAEQAARKHKRFPP